MATNFSSLPVLPSDAGIQDITMVTTDNGDDYPSPVSLVTTSPAVEEGGDGGGDGGGDVGEDIGGDIGIEEGVVEIHSRGCTISDVDTTTTTSTIGNIHSNTPDLCHSRTPDSAGLSPPPPPHTSQHPPQSTILAPGFSLMPGTICYVEQPSSSCSPSTSTTLVQGEPATLVVDNGRGPLVVDACDPQSVVQFASTGARDNLPEGFEVFAANQSHNLSTQPRHIAGIYRLPRACGII